MTRISGEKISYGGSVAVELAAVSRGDPVQRREPDLPGYEPPGRNCFAVDHRERPEHPVRGDQLKVPADDCLARRPAEQYRLERAKKSRWRQPGRSGG